MKIEDDFVSVVIVNYNGRRFLKACLDSISSQSAQNYEIILVDNNSKDDSVDFVKRNYPHVKVIQCSENHGFAKGNNIGVGNSKGRYIILLNNDTKVEYNFVEYLYKELSSKSEYGAVSASMYDGHNPVDLSLGGVSVLGYCLESKIFEIVPDTFLVGLAGGIFDRTKIPIPFDDDYFLYYEDIYFAWLNKLKGYRTFVTLDTLVWHYGSGTAGKRTRIKVFFGERNRIMNIILFYSNSTLIKLLPLILLNMIIAPLRALLVYRRETYVTEYLKGYLWILTHFGLVMEKRWKIQAQRRVSDEDILKYFTYKISDGRYSKVLNTMANIYCKMAGIWTHDMN